MSDAVMADRVVKSLAELAAEAEDIGAFAVVTQSKDGYVKVKYLGDAVRIVGLLEIAKINIIDGEQEEGD